MHRDCRPAAPTRFWNRRQLRGQHHVNAPVVSEADAQPAVLILSSDLGPGDGNTRIGPAKLAGNLFNLYVPADARADPVAKLPG